MLGATGSAWLAGRFAFPGRAWGAAAGACVVRPQQTEGPYFVDEDLHRSDVRADPVDGELRPGVPLALSVLVSRMGNASCEPLEGARVDLWQCDARGVYSGVRDPGFDTLGLKFLRGYQLTDPHGEARFLTIFPGWYPGRTVHIHFKVRTPRTRGPDFEFTSQWYFDDALIDRVHTARPYATTGRRRIRNADDRIFRRGGDRLLLQPRVRDDGYAAQFGIGLELA
jgi:protocatechuate 3,4-dioxygenase beta subunit